MSSVPVGAVVSVVPPREVLICGAGLGVRSLGSLSDSLHKQKGSWCMWKRVRRLIVCCCFTGVKISIH